MLPWSKHGESHGENLHYHSTVKIGGAKLSLNEKQLHYLPAGRSIRKATKWSFKRFQIIVPFIAMIAHKFLHIKFNAMLKQWIHVHTRLDAANVDCCAFPAKFRLWWQERKAHRETPPHALGCASGCLQ